MKKGVLILFGILMMTSTLEAKTDKNLFKTIGLNYYYNKSVNFFENGIEFFVFTNGDFDFNSNSNNRRNRIDRDYSGRIRRIGNISLSYDFRGNVTRIGNISIRYYGERLTNVGNLRVRYDNWDRPIFYGNVRDFYYNNGIRFNVNFGDVCNYNDAYFYRNDFRKNYSQIREDRNFYYYKARTNAKIGKRSTIIKRRKPASSVRNSNNPTRSSNNSFRKNDLKLSKTINRKTTNHYDKGNNIKRGITTNRTKSGITKREERTKRKN